MPHFRTSLPALGVLPLLLAAGSPVEAKTPKPSPQKVAGVPRPLAAPVKVTSVEGITEYRLANGLRVLLFPDLSKPTTTVNITYLVGSRHENYGETGMAHLLEHLVFKGTERYSGERGTKTPVEILNQLGARFNGTTSFDRTNYFITFPASDSNLDQILDLERERMGHSLIREKDLWDKELQKGEMTVVRNEFEAGENNPFGVTLKRALSVAFDWHNYGKTVIGCKSDIENVSIERLRAFYKNYYTPDNAVLLVAGKMNEAKTLAKINERFGSLPKPTRALEPTYTTEPIQDGERFVTVRRVGETPLLIAGYKIPSALSEESASIDILGQIMANSPSGRLYKGLVETKKVTEVFPIDFSLREPGILFFGAVLSKEQDPEAAKTAMLQILENMASQPVTQEEVDRARTESLKWIELTLTQSDNLGINLSNDIAQGDWRLFFLNRDRLQNVTPASVQKAAQNYLRVSNRTLAQFIPSEKPERTEFPVVADAATLVQDYKGKAAIAQGEDFDVAYKAIDARTQKTHLPVGLKVSMVPKKTRGGTVSIAMNLHWGTEASLQGLGPAADLCGSMLMRGSELHTRQQIKDAFDKLKAQVNIWGGAEGGGLRVMTVRENLPEVLKLVAEVLRKPAFPESEFNTLVQEWVTNIQYSRTEPQALASQALNAQLNPYPKGHVRHVSTFDESIDELKGVKLEDLKAFHRAFYGARGELAFVGDIDPKATLTLVTELFGDWKAEKPYERIPAKIFEVPVADKSIETPDKANAILLGGYRFPLRDDDPDFPAMTLGNRMLGGGALKSRFADRIRQREGLSYGVGSSMGADSEDRVGNWSAYAIYNPANADKLRQAFQEEMALVLKDGFKPEEIADAKLSWKQSLEVSRASEQGLSQQLTYQARVDRDMTYDADLEQKVMALTNDQILAALRKYLDPAKINWVKAGDFAKAAKGAK